MKKIKIEEKQVKVGVGVLILKGRKILLGLRHDDPKKASSELHGEGTWSLPGGGIDFGESFEDVCYREVYEECGLRLNKQNIELISIANDRETDAQYVTIGFLCRKFRGKPKIKEPDEITDWKWFDLKNLPKNTYIPSKEIIYNFLTKKNYKK